MLVAYVYYREDNNSMAFLVRQSDEAGGRRFLWGRHTWRGRRWLCL